MLPSLISHQPISKWIIQSFMNQSLKWSSFSRCFKAAKDLWVKVIDLTFTSFFSDHVNRGSKHWELLWLYWTAFSNWNVPLAKRPNFDKQLELTRNEIQKCSQCITYIFCSIKLDAHAASGRGCTLKPIMEDIQRISPSLIVPWVWYATAMSCPCPIISHPCRPGLKVKGLLRTDVTPLLISPFETSNSSLWTKSCLSSQ